MSLRNLLSNSRCISNFLKAEKCLEMCSKLKPSIQPALHLKRLQSSYAAQTYIPAKRKGPVQIKCTVVQKCGKEFRDNPCPPAKNKRLRSQELVPGIRKVPPEQREIFLERPPECCGPCLDAMPSFDKLYYRKSDKKRPYQKTWNDCPVKPKKYKVVCCFTPQPLRLPKRKVKERPETACANPCRTVSSRCPRLKLENCRIVGRKPPLCFYARPKCNCKKRNAPKPAYSECPHYEQDPEDPEECKCSCCPKQCEMWREFWRRRAMKKLK